MQREALLAGGAAAVLSLLVLAVVVVPGTIASPAEDRLRPSRLDIRETSLAAGTVGGETATIEVTTRLDHRGGPAHDIEVYYRAVDQETGLVVDRTTRSMGNITGDREVESVANLTVPREGGYRLDTVVYEDGRRIEQGQTSVRGVGSLVPAYADTPVRFHQFGGASTIPPIEYSIQRVENNRTTVNVSAYLTNSGDAPVGDLRVVLLARQADSNIVADRASVPIGEIRPGRTVTPSATLSVPDDYSYYLDAVLWKDGVIVGSARTVADLDPQRTVPANQTREDVDLDADEFAAETEEPARDRGEGTPSAYPTEGGGPGFGLAAAVVALTGAGLLARRWSA
jgi:PGF-CTERM protein